MHSQQVLTKAMQPQVACRPARAARTGMLTIALAILAAAGSPADDKIPTPEYFGVYAVSGGKLFGIDVPQNTMAPERQSIPLGERAASGDITNGKPTAHSQSVDVPQFPANVQFLVFMQKGGTSTPMMVAKTLYIRALLFVRSMSVDLGWPSNIKRTSPENAWDASDVNPREILGQSQGDITKEIRLLQKPVSGHDDDMVLAVPAEALPPGVYALAQEGKTIFRFAVGPASEGQSQRCADVKCSYAMQASRCEAVPCRTGAGSADSPASSPQDSSGREGGSVTGGDAVRRKSAIDGCRGVDDQSGCMAKYGFTWDGHHWVEK